MHFNNAKKSLLDRISKGEYESLVYNWTVLCKKSTTDQSSIDQYQCPMAGC